MIFAAIWYTEDQNAPSDPFVLELDVGSGTPDEIAAALITFAKANVGEKDEEGTPYKEPKLTIPTMFGEYTVETEGPYLIASSQGWGK